MKKSYFLFYIATLMLTILGLGSAKAVTITSIVPENETVIDVLPDGSAIATITFSGPARITKAYWPYFHGATYTCEYENAENNETYGTKWRVIFPASYVKAMLLNNVGYVIAEVSYSGQDGTSGKVNIQYDINANPGIEFEVITKTSALGFMDYFHVESSVGYVDANNHFFVFDDGSKQNPFEEITITGLNGFVARAVGYSKANNQTVYFSPAITESGTYTIHFPYRAFNIGIPSTKNEEDVAPPEGDESYFSIEKDYTFTVTIEEATFMEKAELITPVSPYLSALGRFEFSYEGETIHLVNPADAEDEDGHILSTTPLTLTIQDAGVFDVYPYLIYNTPGNPDIDFGSDVAVLSEDPSATQLVVVSVSSLQERLGYALPYGQYSLGIPAGVFANEDGAINPPQSFEVTVMRSSEWGEVTPPSMDADWNMYEYNATELAEVTVIWEEGTISKVIGSQEIMAYPETEGVEPVELRYNKDVFIYAWEEGSPLIIDLSSLAAGFWNVSIPEGYVTVGGDLINSQQTISYHIVDANTSGINAIPTEEGVYKVYDFNGINILTTKNVDALLNLPSGLYIINGQKTLLRR